MIVLLPAALVGALLGFALLRPSGALAALLGAQLGAISLAFLMCPILALWMTKVERKQSAGFRLNRVVARTSPVAGAPPVPAVISKYLEYDG
jgi:hypothetical protein